MLSAPQWGGSPAKKGGGAVGAVGAVGAAASSPGNNCGKYLFKPTVVSSAKKTTGATLILALHCPAGTGATVYNGWVNVFKAALQEDPEPIASTVHLIPIELPGRGLRMKEPLKTRMEDLSSEITAALEGYCADHFRCEEKPRLAVLGHSLGGWIGFEVMKRWKMRVAGNAATPVCLIASGIRSPTLCGVENDIDATAMHALDESDFWEVMEKRYGKNRELEHPSVRRMMWPILQADFTVSETYAYDGGKIDMPIFVSGGGEDVRYDEGMLEAWRGVSADGQSFEVEMFDGGHHYLFEAADGHVAWVMARLRDVMLRSGDQEIDTDDLDKMGELEEMRAKSDRASLVSEVESSIFANPGTTQTLSDAAELAKEIVEMEATIEAMDATIEAIHSVSMEEHVSDATSGKPRTASNEPRCSRLCAIM